MIDVQELSYAAIVVAVLDGKLTQEEADAELKRRASATKRRVALTHLAASAKDDEE